MSQVHIAIIRQVKPGMERAFEDALREFARVAGSAGHNRRAFDWPVPGSRSGEYGILRSFESDAACQAFYDSEMFRQWDEYATQFVVGGWTRRRLLGPGSILSGRAGRASATSGRWQSSPG